MKKTTKRIVVLVAFICGALINHVNAQTDVRILDLSIIPLFKVQDSLVQDSVELMVQFKINKPAEAQKVHFWLGTAKDSSDVLIITPPVFVTNDGTTTLTYDGQIEVIKKYSVSFHIKVSSALYSGLFKATLFVETNTGQLTSRLYF